MISSSHGRIAFDSPACVLPIRQAEHNEVEDDTKDDKSSVQQEADRLVHSQKFIRPGRKSSKSYEGPDDYHIQPCPRGTVGELIDLDVHAVQGEFHK